MELKLLARATLVCLLGLLLAVVQLSSSVPLAWPQNQLQLTGSFLQTAPISSGLSARLMRRQTPSSGGSSSSSSSSSSSNQNKKNRKRNKQIVAECLEAHNKFRRIHGVPDLEWSDKLATFAQKRSNHIAASDGSEFGHPPDLPFGENLYWHSDLATSCEFMVRGWYDEIEMYDFKAPSFSPATGHFTQVIWRSTTQVGCAFAESSGPRGGLYLTCSYDPAGNWAGEFVENVPPPASDGPGAVTKWNPTNMQKPSTTSATGPMVTSAQPAPDQAQSTTNKLKNKNKKKKDKKDKNKKKNKRKNKNKNKTTTTTTTTTTASPASGYNGQLASTTKPSR